MSRTPLEYHIFWPERRLVAIMWLVTIALEPSCTSMGVLGGKEMLVLIRELHRDRKCNCMQCSAMQCAVSAESAVRAWRGERAMCAMRALCAMLVQPVLSIGATCPLCKCNLPTIGATSCTIVRVPDPFQEFRCNLPSIGATCPLWSV